MLSRTCAGTCFPTTSTRIRAGPADICSIRVGMVLLRESRFGRLGKAAIRNSQFAAEASSVVCRLSCRPSRVRRGRTRDDLPLSAQDLDETLAAVDADAIAGLDLERAD